MSFGGAIPWLKCVSGYIGTAFLLLCSSCEHPPKPLIQTTIPAPSNPQVASTAFTFPDIDLPIGWDWEEVEMVDSSERSVYKARFPQSTSKQNPFNTLIRQAILKRIALEATFVDPYQGTSPSTDIFSCFIGLAQSYQDHDWVSLTFVVDCYTEGGNHHNYSWFAMNFDRHSLRQRALTDIFSLEDTRDSIAFAEIVKRHRQESNCEVQLSSLPTQAVTFKADSLIILTDDSWACGLMRTSIPMDSLRQFLK